MQRCRQAILTVVLAGALSAPALADLEEARDLAQRGKVNQALGLVAEHLRDNPHDPHALFLRGLMLAESRKEGEAQGVYEELSELRPDRPEPYNNLAVLQAAAGDYELAVETLKEALRTDPAYRTVYENLTKIYGQLASEAYGRALNVDQVRDRSAVELVMLSEMILPETEMAVLAAAKASEDRPDKVASSEAARLEEEAGDPVGPPVEETQAGGEPHDDGGEPADEGPPITSPEEAIAEALARARAEREAAGEVVEEEAPTEPMLGTVREPVVQEIPVESETLLPNPADLAAVVEAWAKAWSDQRVDDYLYLYSSDFVPTDGSSREAWESLRRQRLTAPEYIEVSVAFLDFELDEEDRAVVRFNQSYESNTFSDVVTKALELAREGGEWKIVAETVES